ncbi:MAG: gamma carbonic anhydrase family protein [Alphaproteobacteria bacterium]|nr:gamma carbonic anhydrase family protein [Alphaproteobacteria bacterium]
MSAPLIIPFAGKTPKIAADAFVAPGVVLIGDVEIGAGASIWFGCVLRGDVGPIRVGARSNIQDITMIHADGPDEPTIVGDDVTVGHHALLHTCVLENGSFVGMAATVMEKVVVETGAMVAAGALVTPGKRVRKGELWGGSPAKLLRPLRAGDLEHFHHAVEHYCEKGRQFRKALGWP